MAQPEMRVVGAVRPEIEQDGGAVTLRAAAEMVLSQRQQMGDLLDRVRRKHREHLRRLREVEQTLQETVQQLQDASVAADERSSAEHTLQVAALRERYQQLRQKQVWLAERLIDLATTARKLQTVIRQAQLNADYLLGDVGDDGGQVERSAELGQLRALEVQEEERQRLAREIHDGPAQVLANAIFELEFCQRLLEKDPSRLEAELTRLKDDLREGLAEVRHFIFDLRPGPLADLGLVATLRRYAESYQSRFGLALELDLDDDLQRLSPAKEMAIFRVIQEALQNARKHSGAGWIGVSLRRDGDYLVATVEDDGRGFEAKAVPATTTRHFGLLSMQERAQLIRADLQIASEPGRGTKVSLRVPLDQHPEL